MRKRLWKKFSGKTGKRGFTLVELLTVVGIIAILCGVVFISASTIIRNMNFKQRNDYAKTIFMAAQTRLSKMHSDGTLATLQGENVNSGAITAAAKAGVADLSSEYVYTYSGLTAAADQTDSFAEVLPADSLEAELRGEQIIIEYNPVTGNVYSVFYSEASEQILSDYISGNLPREDEAARKSIMLGYYSGSGLSSTAPDPEPVAVEVEFDNGEEGVVTVKVTAPSAFYTGGDKKADFASGLSVSLTLTGETSGKTKTLELLSSGSGPAATGWESDGITRTISYTLDSLAQFSSFANLVQGSSTSLTAITNESQFTSLLPGENVTIRADVSYSGEVADLDFQPGLLAGVNPMFDYLIPDGSGSGYILAVANGRNLQNLNAIVPSVARMVSNVVFSESIDWNETVAHYGSSYTSASTEAPARALPNFVPIHNRYLFGAMNFAGDGNADVIGNGNTVSNLKIDVTGLSAKSYYANGGSAVANNNLAGLFAFIGSNTNITGLNVANATVTGLTVGGLTGQMAGGRIYNCKVSNSTLNVANATYVGGLVGINSADIVSCSAGVTINYAPTTTAQARIGGLVGQMSAGSIIGGTVSGAIVPGTNITNGTVTKKYFIGGVIGSDAAGVAYQNISSTVTVDAAFRGSNSGYTAVTDPSKVGNGPVGMFVGYVNQGKYSNCTTTATNSYYQFLGEIQHNMEAVQDYDLFSHTNYNPDTITIEGVTLEEFATSAESQYGYTPLDYEDTLPVGFNAELTDCSFKCGTGMFWQKFGDGISVYKASEGEGSSGGYKISRVVDGYTAVTPWYSHLVPDTETDGIIATSYYFKSGDTYSLVYVESVVVTGNRRQVTLYKDAAGTQQIVQRTVLSMGHSIQDESGNDLVLYITGYSADMYYIITDVDFTVALLPDTSARTVSTFDLTGAFNTSLKTQFESSDSYSYIGTVDGFSSCFWTVASNTSGVKWTVTNPVGKYKYLQASYKNLLGSSVYYTKITAGTNGYAIKHNSTSKWVDYDGSTFVMVTSSTGAEVGILAVEEDSASSSMVELNFKYRAADCIAEPC